MWERQDVVGVLLKLLLAILIDNADNAHYHWQDYEQDYKDYYPDDVSGKEDLAYKFSLVSISCQMGLNSIKGLNKCSFLKRGLIESFRTNIEKQNRKRAQNKKRRENSRKHSVYPYCGISQCPSSPHVLRRSPFKKKPSLHSKVTTAPGVNWKLDFRPKRGVSRIPHDKIRLQSTNG